MSEYLDRDDEKTYVFDKTIECPVCNKMFITKNVRTGKARYVGSDDDLRPRYQGVDAVKYEVMMCPHCGYAAVPREFTNVTARQRQALMTEIGERYQGETSQEEVYSYATAIHRCKMALLTAMTKPSKLSESSYLCLKLGWLYRGAAEELTKLGESENKITAYHEHELQYLKEAYKGFADAILKEYPPICNMDEPTINCLMSELAFMCKNYENAQQYAYMVISSNVASRKLKDKARSTVEKLKETMQDTGKALQDK